MDKKVIDLIAAEEIAACDRMLQWLEDDYNRPERIQTRQRIADHIGRPLYNDEN